MTEHRRDRDRKNYGQSPNCQYRVSQPKSDVQGARIALRRIAWRFRNLRRDGGPRPFFWNLGSDCCIVRFKHRFCNEAIGAYTVLLSRAYDVVSVAELRVWWPLFLNHNGEKP
jgi:hypothetical protein